MKEHEHKNKNTKAVAGAVILFAGGACVANARERGQMKRYICCAIFLLTLVTELNSQIVKGWEIGLNFSKFQFDYMTPKFSNGIIIGRNYLKKIDTNYDLEYGYYFKQKGQKCYSEIQNIYYNRLWGTLEQYSVYKLNYVEFPIYLSRNIKKFFVSGGGYFSIRFKSYYKTEELIIDDKTNKVLWSKSNTEKITKDMSDFHSFGHFGPSYEHSANIFDYGFCFNIGIRNRLTIKSNFDFGLKDLLDIERNFSPSIDTEKNKNRSFSFSLIYYFSKNYYKVRYI